MKTKKNERKSAIHWAKGMCVSHYMASDEWAEKKSRQYNRRKEKEKKYEFYFAETVN